MDCNRILALADKGASRGELAHAVKEAQHLIHFLRDVTEKVQITGRLRHLELDGHETIELLAIPTPVTDLLGDSTDMNYLHERLHVLNDNENWAMSEPPTYRWDANNYHWSLITVSDIHQLAVAQLIHSGPETFSNWLTSEEVRQQGALPWHHSVSDYRLFNNHKTPIETPDEHSFFAAIGYQFIALEDRMNGDPDYWRTYKLPVA